MRYLITYLIMILPYIGKAQNTSSNTDAFAFLDSLLTKTQYTVEILDVNFGDLQMILTKVQQAMADKKQWFMDYHSEHYVEGEGLPYHENFGVSEQDYERIKNIDKTPPKMYVRDSALLKIVRDVDRINFKTDNSHIKFIEYLEFNLKSKECIFLNDTIKVSKQKSVAQSPFGGHWNGYNWSKTTNYEKLTEATNINDLDAKIIDINLAIVPSTRKTLLLFKYQHIDKGAPRANIDVYFYLR